MKWFSLKPQTKAGFGSEAPDTTTVQGGKKPVASWLTWGLLWTAEAVSPDPC